MLIPCIDLQSGQAVQLVHGRRRELLFPTLPRNCTNSAITNGCTSLISTPPWTKSQNDRFSRIAV